MNWEPFITCAVTGSADVVGTHPAIPVTPAEIAAAAVEAAEAGAAVVHIHVRDPETGRASRKPSLYRDVVERIRTSGVDVLINLTTGMGGDLYVGDRGSADTPAEGSDLVGPLERLVSVEELLPELCTLDCGSMNFGDENVVYIAPPTYLRACAKRLQELGVKPELEVFDLGHLAFVRQLIAEGLVDAPPFVQFCLGVPYGAPANTGAMKAMLDYLPPGSIWTGFGLARLEMPMVAQAVVLGGNVRVGLEDNLYLARGVFATNGQLVERARELVERMGARVVGPDEVRLRLGLDAGVAARS